MKRLLAFPSYIFGPLWIKFSVNNPTYYLEYLLKTQTEDIDAQFLPDGPKLISFLSSILMFLRTFFHYIISTHIPYFSDCVYYRTHIGITKSSTVPQGPHMVLHH